MQREAEEEILKALTPGQVEKLDALKGEPFEWPSRSSNDGRDRQ
jgi:hypothetical protein